MPSQGTCRGLTATIPALKKSSKYLYLNSAFAATPLTKCVAVGWAGISTSSGPTPNVCFRPLRSLITMLFCGFDLVGFPFQFKGDF